MTPSTHSSKAIPRGIAISLIILAVAAASWFVLDKMGKLPGETARGIGVAATETGRALAAMVKEAVRLEPQVRMSSTVVHEGTRETLEIALAEESLSVEDRFEHRWGGSTKVLHTRGRFLAKAGYKLIDGQWFVDLKPDGSSAVMVPAPVILSCEVVKIDLLEDDDGYWNHVSKEDREAAYNRLIAKARDAAAAGSLPAKVDAELQRRLAEATRGTPPVRVPGVRQFPPAS